MVVLDWSKLYFGKLRKDEVKAAVASEEWQKTRIYMKGRSTEVKYNTLLDWLKRKDYTREAKVQVTNYVTALSRGGIIRPKDYLERK